jgi:hypothetical protein
LSTYEYFVKRVRTLKLGRQFLVSTHSPNVPMLGEADRVYVLGSNEGRGWVLESGPAPELAGTIERLLDGGRRRFWGGGRGMGWEVKGEPTAVPERSPSRGPPYWKSTVLRRKALGEAA